MRIDNSRDRTNAWADHSATHDAASYSIRTRFYAPPSRFDGCFTSFHELALDCDGDYCVTDYLQPEWANIRFFTKSTPRAKIGELEVADAPFTATGPSSLPCKFELGTTRMWGIGLLPLGWARFLDGDAANHANGVWNGSTNPVFQRFDVMTPTLCDPDISSEDKLDFVCRTLENLMEPCRDEPKIVRVHTALVAGEHMAVGDLADACSMSIRTLERVCHRYFGFTPKRLMRRQRFARTLATYMLEKGARWTEAMDEEYHDQAQFTREFSEFMTMTPSKYAALDHPILASFMEARARVWGSAVQTLDRPNIERREPE
ncbi:helix-turn-helix domain-containing protein [Erythrobacter sp.]|uniref:helix-turn-helix domain-containing protein n=1 Tax=Erythrobacter sp. TaxID=1042 RepID=UPI002ECA74EA|nr:helix-turn-helix domain-containing protein [Erythrobacter sp.]